MKVEKVFYWIGGIAGVILVLLCAFVLAAPYWVNLESVQQQIETRVKAETGGRATFDRVNISFLPRPHAVINNGALTFKKDDFLKMAEAFQTDTADLASAAEGADLNGIKGPFNTVAQNCKACHKAFRK